MFLQACVILFTGGGWLVSQHALQQVSRGGSARGGGGAWSWGVCSWGCLVPGGWVCSREGCGLLVWSLGRGATTKGHHTRRPPGVPGGDAPGMATGAGGTHPTGMHSCCLLFLSLLFFNQLKKWSEFCIFFFSMHVFLCYRDVISIFMESRKLLFCVGTLPERICLANMIKKKSKQLNLLVDF